MRGAKEIDNSVVIQLFKIEVEETLNPVMVSVKDKDQQCKF